MKTPLAFALWFLFLATLAGCAAFGLIAETEERTPAFNNGHLERLVGSSKEGVEASLGAAQYHIGGEKKSYFVYQAYVDAAGVVWFMLPFPAWGEDLVLRCSMLEFDENDILSRFELSAPMRFDVVSPSGTDTRLKDCREAFWSYSKKEIERRAHAGYSDAMYKYATTLNVTEAWKWYCLAAHRGDAKAQYTLGNYHRLGLAHLKQDVVEALVWYTLSFEGGYATAKQNRDRLPQKMTPAQIAEAERLVTEWDPNPEECEVYAEEAED